MLEGTCRVARTDRFYDYDVLLANNTSIEQARKGGPRKSLTGKILYHPTKDISRCSAVADVVADAVADVRKTLPMYPHALLFSEVMRDLSQSDYVAQHRPRYPNVLFYYPPKCCETVE